MSGAMVSLMSTLIMGLLFITEFNEFLKVQTVSEMFIDINRGGEKLTVNVDLIFPRFPCDIISLDAQDVMGTHHVNVGGNLEKKRLNRDGVFLADFHDNPNAQAPPDMIRLKQAFIDNEGCRLVGSVLVNKVPGNFHVSSHAYQFHLGEIYAQNGISTLDLSHKINHVSFGSDDDIKEIKKKFNKGVLNPLDGVEVLKNDALKNVGVMSQYYINVVPTTYQDLNGKELYVHQFAVNSNSLETFNVPAVYFRYDLSPVTVKFTMRKESFFHFLVQICAIIGGIFTVAGIIDSLIHKSVVHILKKAQMGKLG
jgi:hypothetical protein